MDSRGSKRASHLPRGTMESPRQQVNELEAKNKSELNRILEGELDDEYTRDITNSLRNDFMRACCVRIAPNERPLERVREHPNYEGVGRKRNP